MPRVPRLHVDGEFYHAILRGNHGRDSVFLSEDRARFSDLVAENVERFRIRVMHLAG